MITAHKIRLSPTPAQAEHIGRMIGYARVAHNHALEHFKERLALGEFLGEMELRKWWNSVKDERAPWHNEKDAGGNKIHSEIAAKNAIKYGLGRALRAWAKYRAEKKKGVATRRVGFPRFRAHGKKGDGWRVSNGRGLVKVEGRRVKLPIVGWVKMTEKLRFAEPLIVEVTVTRRAGKWFISFTCEVADPVKPDLSGRPDVSIDAGERTLATVRNCATGEIIRVRNPRALERAHKKLRREQKKLSRRQRGSKRRERARRRVARLHYRIACIRQDNIHKATSAIARLAGRIVVEDLDVARMAKRRRKRNARGLYDAGMAEFLRILKYKAERAGIEVVEVDPAYTSKTCSVCGHVNRALKSAEWWTCPQCGTRHHRDVNASAVIYKKDKDRSTGSSPEQAGREAHAWLARGDGVRRTIAAATVRETRNSETGENSRKC